MSSTNYDGKLAEMILGVANNVRNSISVEVDSALSTVSITDDTGEQEAIFLDGHTADSFIDEARALYEAAGTVTLEDAQLYKAAPIAENLFN